MKVLLIILSLLPVSGVFSQQLLMKQERDNSPPGPLPAGELAELGDPLFRHVLQPAPGVSKLSEIAQKLKGSGSAASQLFVVDENIISSTHPAGRRAVISYAGTDSDGKKLDGTVMLSISFSSEAWNDEPRSIEAWGWDSVRGRYNYYKREGNPTTGTWRFRGNSVDADLRSDQQRQGTCMRCHINGAPIMKELLIPWNNWRGLDSLGETAYLQSGKGNSWPVSGDSAFASSLKGAEILEGHIINSISRFNKKRVPAWIKSDSEGTPVFTVVNGRRTGTVTQPRRMLRPLFETTEVQLASSRSLSGRHPLGIRNDDLPGQPLGPLPSGFFLNGILLRGGLTPNYQGLNITEATDFSGKVALQRGEYRAFVDSENLKFGGQPGDTHTAFLVPEPSHVDNDLIDQAMKVGALTAHFTAATLAVDWQTPVFSTRRLGLIRFLPATYPFLDPTEPAAASERDALTQQVIAAVEISNPSAGSAEAEWLTNLKAPDAVALLHTQIQQRLSEVQAEFSPADPAKRRQNIQLLLRRMITVRRAMLSDPRLKALDETQNGRLLPVP